MVVPRLPALSDPSVLHKFWNNKTPNKERTVPRYIIPLAFSDLEYLGDAVVNWAIRTELRKVCGDEYNLAMRKLLDDHAKGNAFFIRIAQSFKLHELLKYPPEAHELKDWANSLEAWIGAAVLEGELWNESNEILEEVRLFIRYFLVLRYRSLADYFISATYRFPYDRNDGKIVKRRTITHPGDPYLRNQVQYIQPRTRVIGYEAKAHIHTKTGVIEKRGLGATEEAAENAAKRSFFNDTKDESNRPFTNPSTNSLGAMKPQLPEIFKSKNLFSVYRSKWFNEIENMYSHGDGELQFHEMIAPMRIKYEKWIKELDNVDDSEDRRKTMAMMKWNQV